MGTKRRFPRCAKNLPSAEKETTTYDPDNQVAQYLRTMADFHAQRERSARNEKLTGRRASM
jgi:hypothetical protein